MNLTRYVEALSEFLLRPVVRREALWRDASGTAIIPHPAIGMLYALRGAGKTMTSLDLGLRVAAASQWGPYAPEPLIELMDGDQRGIGVRQRRRVLFVDGEMPEADLQARLRLMCVAELEGAADSCFLLGSDRLAAAGQELNLSKPNTRASLTAIIEEFGIDFMVLDNWVSLMHDLDENDNAAIGPVARWLARLRHDGTSVLLVHHAGKEGKQRGASAREDILDYSIRLRPLPSRTGRSSSWRLEWDKVRGGMPDPAQFILSYREGRLNYRPGLQTEILRVLDSGPMTVEEIAAALGRQRASLDRRGIIREMERAGLIAGETQEVAGRGRPPRRWRIAPQATDEDDD